MKRLLITSTTLASFILAPNIAMADERDDKIERLEKQMMQLMAELKTLKKNQKTIDQNVSQKVDQHVTKKLANMAPAAGAGSNVKVSMKPSPKIESLDGKYSFQPFGRMHLDYTSFDDDQHNHADNSDWRRARFGFKGTLGDDLSYKYEMDLADENVAFRDIYLRYSGLDSVDLTVGHFKPFQGFNELVSSNYISLIERAAPMNIFARQYTTGVSVQSHGDIWGTHLGIFGEEAGTTGDNDDENYSVAGRVTAAPYKDNGHVLHFGVSGSHRVNKNSSRNFTLSTRGETGDGDTLINTGNISNVESSNVYGLELAAAYQSFHAQAEYMMMDVKRDAGSTDADFDGWYAQAGYILTGETRPYKVSSGTFSRIKPKNPFSFQDGTWGAWEVAGRFSNTDLNDVGAGITGGELDVWTAGLNWYVNNHSRVMLNYRSAETDINGVNANDSPKSFTVRTQFDF